VTDCVKRVESSNYQTLEALVDLVAEICLNGDFADLVIVRAEKPSAVLSNEGTGVQIRRSNQGKLSNEQILGVVAMSQLP
jgi:dihydroneopterin aldolase